MARFGKKLHRLVMDELTDTTLSQIDVLFEDNDVPLGLPQPLENDPGQRRERGRRYFSSLELASPTDFAKLTGVLSDLMQNVAVTRNWNYYTSATFDKWMQTLRADGFEVDETTFVVSDPSGGSSVRSFTPDSLAAIDDASVIQDHLNRLDGAVDADPRLAVSSAKALVESTAKLVLRQRGQEYSKSAKMTALVSASQEAVGLAAKSVSDENAAFKQVLQSLASVAQGISELRNNIGVDHGAESVPAWVDPRHARLVVGAAHAWCQFMLETLADPKAPWRNTAGTEL